MKLKTIHLSSCKVYTANTSVTTFECDNDAFIDDEIEDIIKDAALKMAASWLKRGDGFAIRIQPIGSSYVVVAGVNAEIFDDYYVLGVIGI